MDNEDSWGRGTKMSEAKANFAASEASQADRMRQRTTRPEAQDTGFARGQFTKRDAPVRTGGEDGGDNFMRRPARAPRDDGPGDAEGFKKGGVPTFTRGGTNRRETGGMGGAGASGGQEDAGLGFRSSNQNRGGRGGDRGGRGGGERRGGRGGMGGPGRSDNAGGGGGDFGGFRTSNASRK